MSAKARLRKLAGTGAAMFGPRGLLAGVRDAAEGEALAAVVAAVFSDPPPIRFLHPADRDRRVGDLLAETAKPEPPHDAGAAPAPESEPSPRLRRLSPLDSPNAGSRDVRSLVGESERAKPSQSGGGAGEGEGPPPNTPAPRSLIMSGLTEAELAGLVDACRTAGLPSRLFAALTPASADWELGRLLAELARERAMTAKRRGRP